MAFLEGGGLVRQCGVLLAFLCPMVGHGKKQASDRAKLVLVAESGRFAAAAELWVISTRFSLYLRVRVYLDSVYPQSGDQLSQSPWDDAVPRLRSESGNAGELLLAVRSASCDGGVRWGSLRRGTRTRTIF